MVKPNLLKIRSIFIAFFFLFSSSCFAQLPDFSLAIVPTPQSCLGNGSLAFTVIGNNPAASISYAVYLLPNVTTPVTVVTALQANGLVAGSYQVIATQTLNNQSNTAMATTVIADNTVQLSYTLQVNGTCNNDITVNVVSGIVTGYEIISGPVTRPLQTANVFQDLPAGQYEVRVYDSCNDAVVQTIQLTPMPVSLYIGPGNAQQGELPSCNVITVENSYTNNYPMAFPVTFQYTVHPPTGPVIILTQTQSAYNQNQTVIQDIPFYNGQAYFYDLKITDACGNQHTSNNNVVNETLEFLVGVGEQSCGNFLLGFSEFDYYTLPLTVNFLSAPAGFVPSVFNASHPVINSANFVYGSDANPVPLGIYNVQIVDACGNSATREVNVTGAGIPKKKVRTVANCLGEIEIVMPFGRDITSAVMTEAPAGYGNNMPNDVTSLTVLGVLFMDNLPVGDYVFEFTDACGVEYVVEVTIPAPPAEFIYGDQMPGCSYNDSSVRLSLQNNSLVTVVITAAPDEFEQVLPYDVSSNIDSIGWFHMNSLPIGNYVFETIDACGNVRVKNIQLTGFQELSNDVEVIYNCNSFDIDLRYSGSNSQFGSFCLQKYNPDTDTWGHPETGVPYISGNPDWSNSVFIYNNQINYNLNYDGQFRILYVNTIYSNASTHPINDFYEYCTLEIYNFSYLGMPKINGAYAFPCMNGLSEVIIDAEGLPPLTYEITSKNDEPFIITNGQSPYFFNLEDATYNFKVTDSCLNINNIQFDITDLSPLEIIGEGFCEGEAGNLHVREFNFLEYKWWKEGAPGVILSTSAQLDFTIFNSSNHSGKYYLRIVSTTPGSCIDVTIDYTVVPAFLPNAGHDAFISLGICNNSLSINLNDYLDEGSDENGVWQDINNTGALEGGIFDAAMMGVGTYSFLYSVSKCNTIDEAIMTVEIKDFEFPVINIEEGCISDNYTVTVLNATALPDISYHWTGPENFVAEGPEIIITDKDTGDYYVTLTNPEGCTVTTMITVTTTECNTIKGPGVTNNGIPKGISPGDNNYNNDFDLSGLNVQYLKMFNRYGLEVYNKAGYINEWHGQTDKGNELPTGTYYYVITLATGGQVTGWVYLQRTN